MATYEKLVAKSNRKLEKQKLKEKKTTPEYWFKEGYWYRDYKPKKAIKLLEKAVELGHDKADFEIAKIYQKLDNYDLARKHYKIAISKGVKEAPAKLEEMEKEYDRMKPYLPQKKTTEEDKIHVTYKHNNPLFAAEPITRDKHGKFIQEHTFITCPACRAETKHMDRTSSGIENTMIGKTYVDTFECSDPECGLVYKTITTVRVEYRKKEPSWKEILLSKESNEEERVDVITIEYTADKNKVGKDVLKILKDGGGEFIRR